MQDGPRSILIVGFHRADWPFSPGSSGAEETSRPRKQSSFVVDQSRAELPIVLALIPEEMLPTRNPIGDVLHRSRILSDCILRNNINHRTSDV